MPATGFESFLVDFGIVFLFAVLGTLVSLRVRMPPVVGLLVAGFVAGSQGLGLLTNNPAVDVLAELGAVLLLFMVGLEFSLTKIIRFGLRSAIIATGMMGGVFLLVYETGIFMGFGFLGSVVMGAMLCITSTAIFVKVLESNGLLRRPEVPLLVSVLVVEDVLAVMALAFFSALKAGSTVSVGTIVFSIAVSLAVLGATYFLARTVMRRIYPLFKDFQSTDTLIFLAMGLVGVFAFFAAYLRLSPAIGAFLAGSMLSSLPNHKELENAVKPFSLLFAALFFISMGVHINPGAIAAAFLPSGLFILAFLAGGFLVMTTLYFLLAPKNHSSVFAGLSMLSLGEFTLLIAREGAPLVKDFDVVGFSAFAVLVTSVACALFVPHEKAVRARLGRSLSVRTRILLNRVSAYTHHLVEAFEPQGVFFSFFGEKLRETSSDVLRVGAAFIVLVLLRSVLQGQSMELMGSNIPLFWLFVGIGLVGVVRPVLHTLHAFVEVLQALGEVFVGFEKNPSMADFRKVMVHAGIALACFVGAFLYPLALNVLRLPAQLQWLSLGFWLVGISVFARMLGLLATQFIPRANGSTGAWTFRKLRRAGR